MASGDGDRHAVPGGAEIAFVVPGLMLRARRGWVKGAARVGAAADLEAFESGRCGRRAGAVTDKNGERLLAMLDGKVAVPPA